MHRKTGLELVWYGSSAGTYAACFGKWRKITEVYSMLYGAEGKPANTGRVSIAVKQLFQAGFLTAATYKSSNWKLYTATMEPFFLEAAAKQVAFTDAEKKLLEDFVGCAASRNPSQDCMPLAGFQRQSFTPAISQVRDGLHALVGMAMIFMSSERLEGKRMRAYLSALRTALGGESGGKQTEDYFAEAAAKIAFEAKTALKKNAKPEDITVFKLAKYLNHPRAYDEMVKLALESI